MGQRCPSQRQVLHSHSMPDQPSYSQSHSSLRLLCTVGGNGACYRSVASLQPSAAISTVQPSLSGQDLRKSVCRNGTAEDSIQKLQLILQLCRDLGVHISPARLGNLCIVPLLSWHHSSWDKEPDIQGVPHVSALSIADYGACTWPQTGPGMHDDTACLACMNAS